MLPKMVAFAKLFATIFDALFWQLTEVVLAMQSLQWRVHRAECIQFLCNQIREFCLLKT